MQKGYIYTAMLNIMACVVIFFIDISSYLEYAIWLLYIIPLFWVSYRYLNETFIFATSALISVLVFAGFFLHSDSGHLNIEFFNRTLFLVVLWMLSYFQTERGFIHKKLRQNINETKLSETAYRESEKQYRSTLDNMMEGCAIIDYNWNYLYVNEALAKQAHLKREDMNGRNILEVIPGIQKSEFYKAYLDCMENRIPRQVKSDFTFEDGTKSWFEVNVQPAPKGIFILSTDKTEHKRAEEELQKSEYILKLILEHANEGIMVYNAPDGKIEAISTWSIHHARGGIKVESDELLPIEHYLDKWIVKDLKTGKKIDPIELPIARALMGATIQDEELLVIRPDETSFIVSVNSVPIFNEDKSAVLSAVTTWSDITERKRAEERLLESEERFSTAFQNNPDMLVISKVDDGTILEVNESFLSYFGWNREEVIGKTAISLKLYSNRKDREEVINNLREKGKVRKYEIKFELNGKERTVLLSVDLLPIDKEKVMLTTVQDITGLKLTENALRESEARFLTAFNSSPDALVICKVKDGAILEFNETFLTFFRWTSEDIIEKRYKFTDIFINAEDKEKVKSLLQQQGSVSNLEIKIKSRTGEERFVLLYIRMLPLHGEQTMLITIEDVTDLKKIELNLTESEAKLLDAQKLARFGNYSIDVTTNEISWSNEMYDIWEIDKNKPVPPFEELFNMIHPDDRENVKKGIFEETKDKDIVESEFRLTFPGDRIKYIHLIARNILDENGKILKRQGIEIDITDRKDAALKLYNAMQELERSNKELEQFAYIASHDLQEPLRMISSFTKLLEKNLQNTLDDKTRDYMFYIMDGVNRMQTLIQDLLKYARVTTNAEPFTLCDLNEIINEVMKVMQVTISEAQAEISIDHLPALKVDAGQFKQLFQNLFSNALKFRSSRKPTILIIAEFKKREWIFSVKDNGIGINQQHFDKIFTIFQRLHEKDKYPGTGIGLAICKKIVERHGGRMWVESEEGKGTTFYFTLPAV